MDEQPLTGGNMAGAVRIGDVVHKPATSSTPSVHALLRHLEAAGVEGVPRALGFDDQGRQMLTYLPGDVIGGRRPWPAWAFADSTLVQVGRWLRRVHDATESFSAGRPRPPGWIVGHQDAAPYNAVMDGERLAGFFDWDTAGPCLRADDLAYSALLWVPLYPQDFSDAGFQSLSARRRRVHLMLDAYGYDGDRSAFGTVCVSRARGRAGDIRGLAEMGDPACIALLPVAATLEQAAADTAALPPSFWDRIHPVE